MIVAPVPPHSCLGAGGKKPDGDDYGGVDS